MKKYPMTIVNAHYVGSNVYYTSKEELEMAIAQMGTEDLKIKQIWFGPGKNRIFIVVE